ncbi:hypothetical protein NSK11_contig00070-0034 [Nocardia seriolae]|uniref:Uncharacterized protein n=1 Tax=Nocardia seriolae TaxID=37332 RepID=A0ABC9YWW5_9NOCA|nr:hypothetical protein NSERKGN1266_08040 [Nocardia seriolae]BEK92807.1 hypothetical protein NSER024013_07130 [Nocardia seriolae]GAM48093.1 hypothetical protein NS07_v2contig00065-0012 [Nocardia seriolae]GAP30019.1 hypothetical protein NSK11_contig00070-0034 [Nocardia seriolae]GEM25985.1 hypothetical protein NS2_42240 [Nocardia seriolae NBRC 15557]
MVVRDRRLSATNSAGYDPNETRTANSGSNTGRWNFRDAIEVWTGGSQRNVKNYTQTYGGVKVPPVAIRGRQLRPGVSMSISGRPERRYPGDRNVGTDTARAASTRISDWAEESAGCVREAHVGVLSPVTAAAVVNSVTARTKVVKWRSALTNAEIACPATRSPSDVARYRKDTGARRA